MTVYSEETHGNRAGLLVELFSPFTNPLNPNNWVQVAFHIWDMTQMALQLGGTRKIAQEDYQSAFRFLREAKTFSPEDIVEMAKTQTLTLIDTEILREYELNRLGRDFPMTASLGRLSWQLSIYAKLYDVWKNIALGLPSEYGLIIPAERYYRSYYARGRPSFRDAFVMWRKKLVPFDLPLKILREDMGFSPELAEKFIEHAYYDPSPGELARINRTIPLSPEYIKERLIEFGLSDEEVKVYQKWIEKEPVKDELIRVSALLMQEYAEGTLDLKTFEKIHREWEFSESEIKLRKYIAQLLRSKYVLKLRRDAKIYLFRRDVIEPDELYEQLRNLGFADEIANAITELEAARKGIVWNK